VALAKLDSILIASKRQQDVRTIICSEDQAGSPAHLPICISLLIAVLVLSYAKLNTFHLRATLSFCALKNFSVKRLQKNVPTF